MPSSPTGGTHTPWVNAALVTGYGPKLMGKDMSIQKRPAIRQIQPMGLWGRLEAIRAPTRGKARKGTNTNRPPTVPQVLEGRVSGAPDKDKRVIAKPATNMDRERPASAQASQLAARVPIPPAPRSCSPTPSLTTPLYRRTVSQTLRLALRESRAATNFGESRQREVRRITLPETVWKLRTGSNS